MHLEPLYDRIIVRPAKMEEVTKGGIIIPDSAQERAVEGEVIETGEGIFEHGVLQPMKLKRGDKILYGKMSGSDIEYNGEALLIMRESDAWGVFRKNRRVSPMERITNENIEREQ